MPPAETKRYSFVEIKEAQRVCGEKMAEAALAECKDASVAQQQIFRAHVSDLCATVFAAALRKYNPEDKQDVAPVDDETAAKLKELATKLEEKEASVKKLRERVPRMAAANARRELAKARKRHASVLLEAPDAGEGLDVDLTEGQLQEMKAAYDKAAASIADASEKLSQVMSHTTETIHIVERAMKRPKTMIDEAMESSPVKSKALLNDQEKSSMKQPSPLRTRLALQLSAAKSV